jgi:hypothetical protein
MYNKSKFLRALSLIEMVIAISASAILISVGFSFISGSLRMIKDIRDESTAISNAVLFYQRLNEELKGKIITQSVSLNSGTAELSFKSDYNEDGNYDNISYFVDNDTIEKFSR